MAKPPKDYVADAVAFGKFMGERREEDGAALAIAFYLGGSGPRQPSARQIVEIVRRVDNGT